MYIGFDIISFEKLSVIMINDHRNKLVKAVIFCRILAATLVPSGMAQSLMIQEDTAGVSLGQILDEMELTSNAKIFYQGDILPKGKWSLQDNRAYEIDDLNGFLTSFN